jgi:fumarylacetoacetase
MALWTSENLVGADIHGDMAQGQDFGAHFGPENIPLGIASSTKHPSAQAVTRLGNKVIFLADLNLASQLPELNLPDGLFSHPTLNSFAALGRTYHRHVREAVQQLIHNNSLPRACQEPISAVQMHLPVAVGDYTDFSCSPSHNRKAGQALMGFPPNLPPGYKRLPIGYAGRSSSIVVSGTSIKRPLGQFFKYGQEGLHGGRKDVVYGPSISMDYELEMAVVVGKEVPFGDHVMASEAGDHIFGFLLLNDWSGEYIRDPFPCSK